MADPLLTLEGGSLSVEPGGQVRVTVTISNPGTLVEGYRLDVVGDGVSGWAEVVPPEVSVYPKEEATAVVVISPPSGGAAPSGSWPFGVRARSLVDPNGSAVVEGQVEVGKVFGLQAKLVPVTSTGRWRGRHVLHVSNWGNAPVKLTLVASDPDHALGFLVRPPVLDLPVGSQATARLWVRGRRPFLRGSPVRVPFSVVGEREGAAAPASPAPVAALAAPDRPTVDGALNQKPVLTRGVLTLLVALLVVAAGLIAWAVTREGPGDPGYVDQFPPDQPQGVRAVATGPTTVNVTWEPVERIQGWQIQMSQGENGPVFQVTDAERAQTSTTVQGLPATSVICFRVVGLGFGQNSQLSEPACATTPELAASATPTVLATLPPPGETAVPSPGGGGQATPAPPAPPPPATPAPPPATVSPPAPPPVSPSPGGTVTPTPQGSPTPGGSPTPPGTGGPPPGAWVAGGYFTSAADPADPLLQEAKAELDAAGLPSALINSGDPRYLDLEPARFRPKVPSWILVSGQYTTEEEAAQACQAVRAATGICLPLRPDPG